MIPTQPTPAEHWASAGVLLVGLVLFFAFDPVLGGHKVQVFVLVVLLQLAAYWGVRWYRLRRR